MRSFRNGQAVFGPQADRVIAISNKGSLLLDIACYGCGIQHYWVVCVTFMFCSNVLENENIKPRLECDMTLQNKYVKGEWLVPVKAQNNTMRE